MKQSQAIRSDATEIQNVSRSNHEGGNNMSTPKQREVDAVGTDSMSNEFPSDVLSKIIQTEEFEKILQTLIPVIVSHWAGKSLIRKIVSRPAKNHLLKTFAGSNGHGPSLLKDQDLTCSLIETIPPLLNVLVNSFHEALKTIETLPPDEKKEILGKMLSNLKTGETGEAITAATRIINEMHHINPTFFADQLQTSFESLIEHIDFGEIKDLLDNSASDAITFVKMLNDVMWHYPAKVLLLISLIPSMANIAVASLKDTVKRFNDISPDLITDISLSFLKEIDGRSIGEFINEVTELIRKLNTGSALLGEPGTPLFPRDLSRILEEALSAIDSELFWKARVAIAEGKESVNNTMLDALRDNPELLISRLDHLSSIRNSQVRATSHKMALIEKLPEQEVTDAISRGVSALDAQEVGEILNLMALLANRVRKLKPEIAPAVVRQFVDALDLSELQDTVKWIVDELGEAMRPLARVVVPQLLRGICAWLTPEEDDNKADVEVALTGLRALLQDEADRS